ncbi:hypothetical protein AB6A40_008675 [Gnathostoma spinigerum]|uniref:Uncharacterized protein n=1 Tax=Gnathostoma spinigerum TaxID=75299 RepID=A0ABD6EQ48_9BILA
MFQTDGKGREVRSDLAFPLILSTALDHIIIGGPSFVGCIRRFIVNNQAQQLGSAHSSFLDNQLFVSQNSEQLLRGCDARMEAVEVRWEATWTALGFTFGLLTAVFTFIAISLLLYRYTVRNSKRQSASLCDNRLFPSLKSRNDSVDSTAISCYYENPSSWPSSSSIAFSSSFRMRDRSSMMKNQSANTGTANNTSAKQVLRCSDDIGQSDWESGGDDYSSHHQRRSQLATCDLSTVDGYNQHVYGEEPHMDASHQRKPARRSSTLQDIQTSSKRNVCPNSIYGSISVKAKGGKMLKRGHEGGTINHPTMYL